MSFGSEIYPSASDDSSVDSSSAFPPDSLVLAAGKTTTDISTPVLVLLCALTVTAALLAVAGAWAAVSFLSAPHDGDPTPVSGALTSAQSSQQPQDTMHASTGEKSSKSTQPAQEDVRPKLPSRDDLLNAVLLLPARSVQNVSTEYAPNAELVGDNMVKLRFDGGVFQSSGNDFDQLEIDSVQEIHADNAQGVLVHFIRTYEHFTGKRSYLMVYSAELQPLGMLEQLSDEMWKLAPRIGTGTTFLDVEVNGNQVSYHVDQLAMMVDPPCEACTTRVRVNAQWDGQHLNLLDAVYTHNGREFSYVDESMVQPIFEAIRDNNDSYARQYFAADGWPELDRRLGRFQNGPTHRELTFNVDHAVLGCSFIEEASNKPGEYVMMYQNHEQSVPGRFEVGQIACLVGSTNDNSSTYGYFIITPGVGGNFTIEEFTPMYG